MATLIESICQEGIYKIKGKKFKDSRLDKTYKILQCFGGKFPETSSIRVLYENEQSPRKLPVRDHMSDKLIQ